MKTVVSLRLDAALATRLDSAAERYGVTKAELLRDAASAWLDLLAVRELARANESTAAGSVVTNAGLAYIQRRLVVES